MKQNTEEPEYRSMNEVQLRYELTQKIYINADVNMPLRDNGLEQRKKRLSYIAERLGGSVFFECNGKEYPQTSNED